MHSPVHSPIAISLQRNGKAPHSPKMRKTEWDFHPKANATLIYFAEANGKWRRLAFATGCAISLAKWQMVSLLSLCHLI